MKIIFQDNDGKVLGEESITELEETVFKTGLSDSRETIMSWIINAVRTKISKRLNYVVNQSGLGSDFSTIETKNQIVNNLISGGSEFIKPGYERVDELKVSKSEVI